MTPRILIVDDDPMVLKSVVRMVSAYLPETGIETSNCVENACNKITDEDAPYFDTVITDYDMPDGKGTAVAQTAKFARNETWVSLMSGGNPKITADIDAFVPKPLLVSALRDMLGPKIYDARHAALMEANNAR
jgi:DNA-binding NtrC family response regulator